MNPPQIYMCSPSWTLLPPPSPYHPSGLSPTSRFLSFPFWQKLSRLSVFWSPYPIYASGTVISFEIQHFTRITKWSKSCLWNLMPYLQTLFFQIPLEHLVLFIAPISWNALPASFHVTALSDCPLVFLTLYLLLCELSTYFLSGHQVPHALSENIEIKMNKTWEKSEK